MLAGVTVREVLTATGVAIVSALLLRLFVVGVFSIPSHSMDHTLQVGDHVIVSKLAYLFTSPHRGDVIVFTLPDSLRGTTPDETFIKRVIATGTDTLLLSRYGITINGKLLPDPPTSASRSPVPAGERKLIVPAGHVFVLGDNRANSWDSRYWGFLPEDQIVGRAVAVYWSKRPATQSSSSEMRWNRMFKTVR